MAEKVYFIVIDCGCILSHMETRVLGILSAGVVAEEFNEGLLLLVLIRTKAITIITV